MDCPKCGKSIDGYISGCPHCARMAQATPQAPTFAPGAASQPNAAALSTAAGIHGADLRQRSSGFAIASLICGLAGLCTGGVTALVGIVLGIIAWVQIQQNPRQLKGLNLAISGTIVSVFMCFMMAIGALIVIPRILGAAREAREESLRKNLAQLRTAIELFQADTGTYPNSLTDLVDSQDHAPTTGVSLSDANGIPIPADSYKGPYLPSKGGLDNSGIPINLFAPPPTGTLSVDLPANWTYSLGYVRAAVPTSGNTLDGVPYQRL